MSTHFDFGEKPHLGFMGAALDRVAAIRNDPAALKQFEADPLARALVIGGELVCLRGGPNGNEAAFTMTEGEALAPVRDRAFLGRRDGAPLFAFSIDPSAAEALKERDDLRVADLRSIATGGLVAADDLPPLALAKALLAWHARHRFCAQCGSVTKPANAGWRRDCPACGAEHFPRTDPVVIMLAVAGGPVAGGRLAAERCLLGRQARFVKGMWSCLAGFVEPGETIEDAVRRETLEEAGIVCGRVAYFASQPWPFPMSLMIGCHTRALTTQLAVDRSELEDARWFSREEVAAMMLRRHPEGLVVTHPFAIAHHLIRAWLECDGSIV